MSKMDCSAVKDLQFSNHFLVDLEVIGERFIIIPINHSAFLQCLNCCRFIVAAHTALTLLTRVSPSFIIVNKMSYLKNFARKPSVFKSIPNRRSTIELVTPLAVNQLIDSGSYLMKRTVDLPSFTTKILLIETPEFCLIQRKNHFPQSKAAPPPPAPIVVARNAIQSGKCFLLKSS